MGKLPELSVHQLPDIIIIIEMSNLASPQCAGKMSFLHHTPSFRHCALPAPCGIRKLLSVTLCHPVTRRTRRRKRKRKRKRKTPRKRSKYSEKLPPKRGSSGVTARLVPLREEGEADPWGLGVSPGEELLRAMEKDLVSGRDQAC